jgi:hypothetical protein
VALVANERDSAPQITPSVGGGLQQTHYKLSRGENSDVVISIQAKDSGEAADFRRSRFAGSREPQRFARWLQEQFPGAQLVGEPKLQLVPSRDPTIIEIEGSVAASALASSGGITVYPGRQEWLARMVPAGERSGPLAVANRPDVAWTLSVELGRPPLVEPEGAAIETPFGSLRIEVETDSTGYEIEGFFHLESGLVAAEDVPELREFLVTVERRLQRRVEAP